MEPRFGGFGFRHDDRFLDRHRFVDHDRFFFAFDFVSFGFPWWYPQAAQGLPGARCSNLTGQLQSVIVSVHCV